MNASLPARTRCPAPSPTDHLPLTAPGKFRRNTRLASPVRIALFSSCYKGFYLLHEFRHGFLRDRVSIVGLATDDPDSPFCNAHRRFWAYPHTAAEKTLAKVAAEKHSIPVHTGRINANAFIRTFEDEWSPDLLLVSAFGQLIPRRIFDFPALGSFNLHPAGETWPSYCGAQPLEQMLAENRDRFFIVLHRIDEGFDHGPLLARSEPIFIPPEAGVKDLHKLSAMPSARFASEQVLRLLKDQAEEDASDARP